MTFHYHCPNCDALIEIDGTPGRPARVWGPPEHCYEATDDEFEPGYCPECGVEFEDDALSEKLAEALDDAATERAIERWESRQHYYEDR